MEWRAFGPTKFRVPVIGQGTWHLEEDDRRPAITALRLGLDLDMTHIDTAQLYGDGVVEQIVGKAIAGRRDDAFLVSKVLPQHATRQGTIEACEGSQALQRDSKILSGRFPGLRTKGGRVLHEIADAHGATPRQVALRWVVRHPSVFAIAKAAKPEHTAENTGAADLSLTAREIARIDEAVPLGRRPRTLPTL
jgi:diketogulonate reductase-like aldo/keto reductase